MSIGSTIKRLRRERDITQENLAEYLGITSRAVSQWECDKTSPDISLLPALCNIFDVSADVLLEIDVEKNNERIKSYLDEAREMKWKGNFEKEVEILREALGISPKSYQIMNALANALVCVYSRNGKKEYDEVFSLCKRIIAECTDSQTRYEAVETLGLAYDYAGKKDEMLKLTKEMPEARFSYENFMVYRWSGDDGLIKRREYMYFLINELFAMIDCLKGHCDDNGKLIHSWDERKELNKFVLSLLDCLFPDGDYQQNAYYGATASYFLFKDHFNKKDYENAWYWLERCVEFNIHADTYDFDATHSTPILRGFADGGWIMEKEGNYSQTFLDWLTTDDEVAVLRSDRRYEKLVERIKKVARKP